MKGGRTGQRGRDGLDALLEQSAEEPAGASRSTVPADRDSGIRYEKIAISLPLRAAESVRRAVKYGRAPSVSAYIAAAIEEKTSRESLIEMLDEMLEETGGPITPAEQRWIDWHFASKRRGKPPPRPASLDRKPSRKRGR